MSSQASYSSNILFQTINDDLNASLATAEELSKEFNSMMKEASSSNNNNGTTTSSSSSQFSSSTLRNNNPPSGVSSTSWTSSANTDSKPWSSTLTPLPPVDSVLSSSKKSPYSPSFSSSPLASPKIQVEPRSPLPLQGSESPYSQQSPKQSPSSRRKTSPSRYDRSPRGSISYAERSPSPSPSAVSMDQPSHLSPVQGPFLSPYDSQMGRRSPRPDRAPSPLSFIHPSATLPRNFGSFKPQEENMQRQKNLNKWNETDLDMSYERKPHHTYEKSEWIRPKVANSSWRESNLDGPPPAHSPKKDPRSNPFQYSHASLPRNTRISIPPDVSSPSHSPYHAQPIISRISIPPSNTQTRQRKPIPLSVIMRLQNPHWRGKPANIHPRMMGGEGDASKYQPVPIPREYFRQPVLHPPELRQPAIYSDALNPADVDAELERLDYVPVILPKPSSSEGTGEGKPSIPRPLSPTRLQPVVAPEAHTDVIPNLEEVLRIRAEIPRALKRRGSSDQSQPLKQASHYQPNQYKNLIDKLFHKKEHRQRGDPGSETSSSSEGEDCAMPPAPLPTSTSTILQEFKGYHSILRHSNRERKGSGKRARLSPLVLLLDGALVGELETVQRAVQEMSDPSQPNDEGITGLHNAVCGGHYKVVDFLVRVGANVSAPDSHGWTPLHCAASCNDRPLCEFLVRNGAAVMAMTESDGAVASQKCDPYAFGFEECESFLRGIEDAMGIDNSGVLYALWSYPAQARDELSFKEGDMVTILQKPEGSDWWWASLCGREGFVPNNYFGLFPKVRPKTIC